MATKITKSELKEMIREALREELSKSKLTEAMATNKTTHVVVLDYYEDQYLDDCLILGWDSDIDWFCEVAGSDIITRDGGVEDNDCGLIEISHNIMAYAGDQKYCDNEAVYARREGIDCIVCQLVNDANSWKLIPA